MQDLYIIKVWNQLKKGVENANEQVELHFQRFNMKLSIEKQNEWQTIVTEEETPTSQLMDR